MQSSTNNELAKLVLHWYDQHGRKDLPWRNKINAYRVWLSEIMLQQTQVKTVIPYFNTFIEKFPKIEALAAASDDEVLHLWSGLGYYSRARNLHKTAKIIANDYAGKFPKTVAELNQLPGVGRSTAGAVAAIAYQQKAPILDGNVKRVLTRIHAIVGWPGKTTINNKLWEIAEQHLPNKRVDDYTQALMDLGATICTRTKPLCNQCPINKLCKATQQKPENFPTPKPKKSIPTKHTKMLLILNQDKEIFLMKNPPTGIWSGLWCFPQCTIDTNEIIWCSQNYGIKTQTLKKLETYTHTFSHYRLIIQPILLQSLKYANIVMEQQPTIWYKPNQPQVIGLPTPIKKIIAKIGDTVYES